MPNALTRKRKDSASIDEYANDIQEIWKKDRSRPVLFQWLQVVAHASVLAEEVRKEAWDKVVLETAEVFVWWLSFVKRISKEPTDRQDPDAIYYLPTSASDIVWFKFPNLCPVCFGFQLIKGKKVKRKQIEVSEKDFNHVKITQSDLISAYNEINKQPCKCMSRKKSIEARSGEFKTFVKEQLSTLGNIPTIKAQKPASLKGLEATIQKIYEPSVFVLTMHEVAFHLLEEIGEVSEALVRLVSQPIPQKNLSSNDLKKFRVEHIKRLKNVREELGDVFSWLIAMRSKTHNVLHRSVNYVERFHTADDVMKTAKQIVKKFLKPTESMVDLVWQIYSDNGNILVCEECKERHCNPKSPKHRDDSGELFGDKVAKVYDQIKAITPTSL
jgi:NTP pyrophosphatase (non-canonical NTP hydrolase)